jgi:hypothetical protein
MSYRLPRTLSFAVAASTAALTTGLAIAGTSSEASAGPGPSGATCLQAVRSGGPNGLRQRTFAAAASTYGVPMPVLEGVSYLESRWDDHGASPSIDGGYGPMHLTDLTPPDNSLGKGDGSVVRSAGPPALHTARRAAALTGFTLGKTESDATANVCAGAALLASYQRALGRPSGQAVPVDRWYDAVMSYSGDASAADASVFAHRVFALIKAGTARTTSDGQRVRLAAVPSVRMPALIAPRGAPVDCPADLHCEWVPAPYDWYGRPDPHAYGNHDLADRPTTPGIRYIVIHDTESTYATALDLVQDPTYLAWNYTIRSSDGHVAQHLDANDVGWHAGNWYVNMHSIGIEHEGFAAQGATWFTENMYESSADLVRYLAKEYDVPLDRAHIIGHDQVPGILRKDVAGMHWDPGPFWDWQHYFDLLGAPFEHGVRATTSNVHRGTVVTVAPGFARNYRVVTGCVKPGARCPRQGTNFVYLHTRPDAHSPLVRDIGLHKHGYSTTDVADIGARADAGQKLVVARSTADWIGVWYLGELGWIWAPTGHSPLVISKGQVVSVRGGGRTAPVYGRAYPERSAYPKQVPYQRVSPLQYTVKAGQEYVVADAHPATDYYYATTYDDSAPHDHTDIVGHDAYEEIWFGHRVAYVRTADVAPA